MPRSKSLIPLFKKLEVKHINWGMFPKTILPIGVCVQFTNIVFIALLLTTENLVQRDVKVTFRQGIMKLMIISRSDLH